MKKRFTNILLKSKKKNGFFILLCAISMTLILGMITGCSIQDTIPSEVQTSTETPNKNPVDNTTAQAASTQIQKSEQDNTKNSDETLSRDGQEIKKIVEEFAAAYFDGDTDIIQSYLTTPYEWDIDIYNGTGTISDLTLKGLTDIGEKETGSTQVVSLEYRDSNDTDSLQYLSMEFIKQVHGWKIQFYGIES